MFATISPFVACQGASSEGFMPALTAPDVRQMTEAAIISPETELHDTRGTGRLSRRHVRQILLSLRVPQLSWDAFARNTPSVQTSPEHKLNAEEFAAGFLDAFVL